MDKKQQFNCITQELQKHPAHLWIGHQDSVVEILQRILQYLFCTKKGCGVCSLCKQITNKQHQSILWLYPEKYYTLEKIEQIGEKARLQLEDNEHFFFVIEKAEALTIPCINRLLKLIEEPPRQYHFILITNQRDCIVQTIQSRCLLRYWSEKKGEPDNLSAILSHFLEAKRISASTFLNLLENEDLTERIIIESIDKAFAYWETIYCSSIKDNDTQKIITAEKKIKALRLALQKPPMPGSCKQFLKNIYLQLI